MQQDPKTCNKINKEVSAPLNVSSLQKRLFCTGPVPCALHQHQYMFPLGGACFLFGWQKVRGLESVLSQDTKIPKGAEFILLGNCFRDFSKQGG